ncbi:hypothetical protein EON81_09515 [bacterium]|nr:MAG: hypothetical protein EON81_09515 [bacterium]
MNHEDDTPIELALNSLPMDGPSEDLRRRVRVAARETPVRRALWRSPLIGSLVATAVVAGIVVGASLMPVKASAKSFDLIVAAAQRVNAYQFSVRTTGGGVSESFSIVGQDGRITMKGSEGMLMRFEPGSMTVYDPEQKSIVRFKFKGLAFMDELSKRSQDELSQGLDGMDLKEMLAEYRQKYGSKGIRISGISNENGHRVYRVLLATPDQPERIEMTVDAATDLPERLNVESKDGKSQVDMSIRYGAQVDPELLKAEFPKNIKVEEIDLGKIDSERP